MLNLSLTNNRNSSDGTVKSFCSKMAQRPKDIGSIKQSSQFLFLLCNVKY